MLTQKIFHYAADSSVAQLKSDKNPRNVLYIVCMHDHDSQQPS